MTGAGGRASVRDSLIVPTAHDVTPSPLIVPCKIASQHTESQRIRTFIEVHGARILTSQDHVPTICVILSDFVGQFRMEEQTPWVNPSGWIPSHDGPFSRGWPAPPA